MRIFAIYLINTINEGGIMKFIANNYSQGEVIRIIREWTELTQKEFGNKIHRSEKGIQAFELEKRNCDIKTLFQIANTFGLKIIIEKEEK